MIIAMPVWGAMYEGPRGGSCEREKQDDEREESPLQIIDDTRRNHVFEAPGLFEQTIAEGSENATVNPMRVYVPLGETVRIQVSAERLNREPGTDASGAQTSHVFCPLHKGEKAFRSQI